MTPPPTLDYATTVGGHLRRNLRRYLRGLVLLLLISAAIYIRKPIWNQIQHRYWCNRCMRYLPPPGVVMRETDPAKGSALVEQNEDYCFFGLKSGAAVFHPECLRQLESLIQSP